MANYLGWEITNKGRELLARAMNNETKINVTKFKIGAGYNTGNDRELTDLLDKRNEFPVNSYERKENGNVEFTFIVSNKTGSGTSAITTLIKFLKWEYTPGMILELKYYTRITKERMVIIFQFLMEKMQ